MKILTFILSISMAVPSWASFGSGLPDNYCAYNASSARAYKPQSVIDAEANLKRAQDKKERLERKLERVDCNECEDNFAFFVSAITGESLKDYTDHMAGGGRCTPQLTNVAIYNYWADVNKWEKIDVEPRRITPGRMIAGGGSGRNVTPPVGPGTPPPTAGDELGGGNRPPVIQPPTGRPVVDAPDFVSSCPRYAGPNGSVDVGLCEIGQEQNYFTRDERRLCRKCLRTSSSYPSGRYAFCLSSEALIAELEDQIADLEDELEDAIDIAAENGEEAVCADCMTDNRSGFNKYGPTALAGLATLAAGYFAYKQERNSYEYYRDVIHPDNNAKGYPTPMMADQSGNAFATVLVGGLPMVLNTAVGTGAFGCSGSSVFGSGMITSGNSAGTQVGGATGVSGILGGLLGGNGVGVNGQLTTGVGATTNNGYVIGANGQPVYVGGNNGVMTTAEIEAQMAQSQQQLAAIQAQQAALSAQYTYANSYNALTQQYQAGVSALGPAPGVAGVGAVTSGGNMSGVLSPVGSSVLTGGVQIGAHLGMGTSVTPPMINAQGAMGTTFNPNVAPSPTTVPSGAGINRL
ncbi:MAG: hypothetical protein ACRBBP_04485 [Bdellovibrionales bacterium]